METTPTQKQVFTGIALAVASTILWAGNFIIARAVTHQVYPFSLAFYRWAIATVIMVAIAWKNMRAEWPLFRRNIALFLLLAITGVSLFNSFVYIAGHYTSAINLALIGTTAAPVFITVMAKFLLKEKVGWLKTVGLLLCISGILYLLSQGSFDNLRRLRFTVGDFWILLAALMFSIYSVLVRRKPVNFSATGFLGYVFALGTIVLVPFYLIEVFSYPPLPWDNDIIYSILYLGIAASVLSYLCWNASIARLGASRTALFGNLIPIFSTIEASLLLHEEITQFHIISFILVGTGIFIANMQPRRA